MLTRPDGTLDVTRMSALVDQVADLHRQGIEVVMVSSGAVASGRGEMRGDRAVRRHLDAVSARQLYSAVGQAKLINRYYELFREHGIVCGQVLTTKEDFATRHQYLNQKHCMEVMIDNGVIPVVNENDTTSVTELMFTDNDELSGLIAAMMGAQALVLLSNVDGVYDGDPADPSSSIIREITHDEKAQADPTTFISKSKSSLGRGGMGSKFRTANKVASEGIAVYIANGRRDGILQAIVAGGDNVGIQPRADHREYRDAERRSFVRLERHCRHTEHIREDSPQRQFRQGCPTREPRRIRGSHVFGPRHKPAAGGRDAGRRRIRERRHSENHLPGRRTVRHRPCVLRQRDCRCTCRHTGQPPAHSL